MKIAIITQPDRLFIPRNVERICREPGIRVEELVLLDGAGALKKMRWRLVRWFGIADSLRMAFRIGRAVLADKLCFLQGGERRPTSLESVASRHGILLSTEEDANAPALVRRLESYDLDFLVSFSAPQVFEKELLAVPSCGCLNLHCSMLPRYRGLLPSFWVLQQGESETGATVHLMDEEIDKGQILRQESVSIQGLHRMVDVLERTKDIGGHLMLEILRDYRDEKQIEAFEMTGESTYFSWPTKDDVRVFRERGCTLA